MVRVRVRVWVWVWVWVWTSAIGQDCAISFPYNGVVMGLHVALVNINICCMSVRFVLRRFQPGPHQICEFYADV